MTFHFTKMHGLGNDFIVIDGVHQKINFSRDEIKALSLRQTGIGFDQCLIIESSENPEIDFNYRIYNANGEPVGQCGNGARCVARFIEHYQLSLKKELKVATTTTVLTLHLNDDKTVTVNMGIARFAPSEIPFISSEQASTYQLDGASIHALSIGNPHAILLVDDLENAPVETLGRTICEHPRFPEQVNVSFMKIISPHHVALRVFERGCGETQACGSAAVAAAAAGQRFHHLAPKVQVDLPGGSLLVEWSEKENTLHLTGPAAFSYEGVWLGF